jgi:hypothetical protein
MRVAGGRGLRRIGTGAGAIGVAGVHVGARSH